MIRSALLNVMIAAAMKAGRGLKRDFGEIEHLQVSIKSPGDFVSIADKRSEKVLREELEKARPGYGFLGEEGGESEGTDKTHRWIVDPLDGTTNFLHGIPHFAISIALERAGQIVAGVIYNPISEDLFFAERGSGAFVNDRRLRVSGRKLPEESLVACGIPFVGRGNHPEFLAELKAIMARYSGVRRFGAAALDLAWVAAGRYDAYWERKLNAWDIAAGIILIKEAGGFVTDCDGKDTMLESGDICAGNEAIHRDVLATLKAARAS